MFLVQVQQLGTNAWYGLEILHQFGKKVKTKSKEVLGAYCKVCRSYDGKTPILNRVKTMFVFTLGFCFCFLKNLLSFDRHYIILHAIFVRKNLPFLASGNKFLMN